jgi:chromosome segregation ATPase
MGNRELLQKNSHLETHVKELNDELMRTYRSRDFKTDLLDNTHTRLQHAQDELTAAQSYVHHLETKLHERDEQLEASQAQTAELQHEMEHLQELIPQEPEEDPEKIEGMSSVEDNYIVHVVILSRILRVSYSLSRSSISACVLCSDTHNFFVIYRILTYE